MLSLIGSILFVIAIVFVVYVVWFKLAYSGRRQDDIPEFCRRFVVSTDNGSRLKLELRKGSFWLGIERKAGSISDVIVDLRIPQNGLSSKDLARLEHEFRNAGRDWRPADGDQSIVARSEFVLPNAWALSSYKEVAVASGDVFRILGVKPEETIRFRTFGKGRVWSPEPGTD